MNPSKQLLKEYLEAGGEAEILNNTFREHMPTGSIVIDNISHDCVGGVRVGISVIEAGDDFAEEYQVKILFMDLITFIYQTSKPLEEKVYALETCISDNIGGSDVG